MQSTNFSEVSKLLSKKRDSKQDFLAVYSERKKAVQFLTKEDYRDKDDDGTLRALSVYSMTAENETEDEPNNPKLLPALTKIFNAGVFLWELICVAAFLMVFAVVFSILENTIVRVLLVGIPAFYLLKDGLLTLGIPQDKRSKPKRVS